MQGGPWSEMLKPVSHHQSGSWPCPDFASVLPLCIPSRFIHFRWIIWYAKYKLGRKVLYDTPLYDTTSFFRVLSHNLLDSPQVYTFWSLLEILVVLSLKGSRANPSFSLVSTLAPHPNSAEILSLAGFSQKLKQQSSRRLQRSSQHHLRLWASPDKENFCNHF